jgi:nucleoside-diphosphate-sugar epimerase
MTNLRCDYDISKDVELLIRRVGISFESLRGKTVFVTGGTGFFGIWMISALVAIKRALNGELRLIALSREPEKFLKRYKTTDLATQIEYLCGDVRDFRLGNSNVTHLVHMANTSAEETFLGHDQLNKIELLYSGTRNVLEQCGRTLENVLFTSSGVAYGVNTKPLISEDDYSGLDTTDISSALGVGKLTAEFLIAYFAPKFNYTYSVARCFAFSGQHLPLNIHYAFGNFIYNALEGKDIIIRSDGQDVRSYLYIGDAITWLLRLLIEPKNQIFNVGSSQSVSIESLAHKIAYLAKFPVKVKIHGIIGQEGNFRRVSYIPSTRKVTSAYTELAEWTSLNEIISKMLCVNSTQNEY